jgi:ABC-2 type transport system permease protein
VTSAETALTVPCPTSVPRSPFAQLLRTEAKLFVRAPASVLWVALLPVAALIVLGVVPATSQDTKFLHGTSYLDAYLPILMTFSLCMCAVNFLPAVLVTYREQGILRRLSTTPVPPARMLGAQLVIYLGVGLGVCAVLAVVGFAGLGIGVPGQIVAFALSVVLIAAATLGVGLVVAAIAPNSRVANAAGAVLFFPLMFLAGLWVPRTQMPTVLRRVSDYSPLGAGVHALQSSITGQWPPAQPLLVLVAYALVTGGIAGRRFSWE